MPSEERGGASTQFGNEFLLEVRHLSVDYHVNSEEPRRTINRLSFEISEGDVIGVLGESGSFGPIGIVTTVIAVRPLTRF